MDEHTIDYSSESTRPLGQALRRWVVIAGYVIGGWVAFDVLFSTIAFENVSLHRWLHNSVLTDVFRLASFVLLLLPFLLIAGCWGFTRRRRWARPSLLV